MALKVAFESSEVGGIWGLVSSAAGTTELGAYLAPEAPTGTHTLTGTITVFWCGDLERNQLPKFVTLAEETLDPSGAVKGSILAFGPTREAGSTDNGGIGKYLEKPSKFFGFDAYRIRLDHGPETFILWTTLQGSARPLNELGENIGICVTPHLFDGPARKLIGHIIQQTRPDNPKLDVYGLLDEISNEFLSKYRKQ